MRFWVSWSHSVSLFLVDKYRRIGSVNHHAPATYHPNGILSVYSSCGKWPTITSPASKVVNSFVPERHQYTHLYVIQSSRVEWRISDRETVELKTQSRYIEIDILRRNWAVLNQGSGRRTSALNRNVRCSDQLSHYNNIKCVCVIISTRSFISFYGLAAIGTLLGVPGRAGSGMMMMPAINQLVCDWVHL